MTEPLVETMSLDGVGDGPRVVVDGLDFTAGGWAVWTIDGWGNGGASVRRTSQDRPTAHGEFGAKGWRGGRLVTIAGRFTDQDHELVHAAEDQLAALLAGGEFGTLAVSEFGRTLTAPMQLADKPDVKWEAAHLFTFTLQLFSPESFRYGATSSGSTQFASDPEGAGLVFPLFDPDGVLDFGPPATSLGLVTVTNAGNAPAAPVFTVAGPSPEGGFIILDATTGRRLIFTSVVPDGQTLTLDARVGTVMLEGVANRLTETIVEAWPVLDPGETRTFSFEPISSRSAAVLTVALTSTYW